MANEMRLIDAEPIKKFIENGLNHPIPLKAFGHDAIEILAEIEYAPTVDAVPVPHNPCGFCGKFEFDSAKAVVGQHCARIVLACASTRYPIEEQFNFCPVCGRSLKEGAEDAAD